MKKNILSIGLIIALSVSGTIKSEVNWDLLQNTVFPSVLGAVLVTEALTTAPYFINKFWNNKKYSDTRKIISITASGLCATAAIESGRYLLQEHGVEGLTKAFSSDTFGFGNFSYLPGLACLLLYGTAKFVKQGKQINAFYSPILNSYPARYLIKYPIKKLFS